MAEKRNELVGGLFLVIIGLLALAGNVIDLSGLGNLGLLFLPGLGGLFLLWGIIAGNDGLLIPGGILSGIGWGSWLVAGPVSLGSQENQAGVFMLVFALGWLSITVLSAIFTMETHWWALIPAAIIGFIGLALTFGGFLLKTLSFAGQAWPLVLILLGIYIIIRQGLFRLEKSKTAGEH